ncbi:MAG: FG-GAP-like repeat-containing protein [Thermodesulfobacteriota bacterium]|jgi:TolB-like protein
MKTKWVMLLLCLIFVLNLPSPSAAQTREPEKVYRVAILPFLIHSDENLDYLREGIYDILASRITVEGRIEVIDQSTVERALYEERPMRLDEAVATKIGTRVTADYIVLGSLTKIGSYISLDARLISITEDKSPLSVYTQHKGIEDVMVKIGDFAQDIGYKILGRRAMAGRPGESKHPYLVQPERGVGRIRSGGLGFKRSQTFDFEIKGLGIGDLYGDKKNEVVVMDDNNLYIFRYDGNKMSLLQKVETGNQNKFLTLDVADVNRNGLAEIIVTSVVGENLQSSILEYDKGKFRKITEKAGWFFRVLEHPKEGPILIGQRIDSEGVLDGPIYKFVWQKESFEKGPKMPFPKKTKIFGIALTNIRGKEALDLLVLDNSDRLRLVALDGKPLWTSGEEYGGTDNSYDSDYKRNLELGSHQRISSDWRTYILPRILIRDLHGDGLNEVIVNRNISSSLMSVFKRTKRFEKGEIDSLVWEEGTLTTNWKTKEITGYISDFQIKDIDNDGEEELVVAVIDPGGIVTRKGTSNLLFFKLS